MIIRLPVQIALCRTRGGGAPAVESGRQASAAGSYRPPLAKNEEDPTPPQMIISLPVQTTVASDRPSGAPTVEVGVQMSRIGS